MSKKSHHFLTLWPWPLTYDLEKLIRSGHYHYQCVYQIWEQSIPWFLSYRVNTIVGGGQRVAGSGRLRRKTITSPDPSDTGDIITNARIQFLKNLIAVIFCTCQNCHYCTAVMTSVKCCSNDFVATYMTEKQKYPSNLNCALKVSEMQVLPALLSIPLWHCLYYARAGALGQEEFSTTPYV